MLQFYTPMIEENRQTWRSSLEIESAAFEHEKRRLQLADESGQWARPLASLNAPLRLLAALLG